MRLKDSTTGALRNRRKALRNPYNENAGECDINLGGFSIVAIVLFLFFLGYFVMESYLTTACANAPSSISSKSQLLRATEAPTAKVEASETPAAESPSPLSPSKEGFPQACTEDQLATLSKQLPADGCRKPAFEQACSFTKATTRGCRDSIWMREFFATTQLPTPFLSFIVGYDPSHASFSDVPLDSLFIGSHKNTNADQKAAWFAMAGVPAEADCKRPVTASSPSQEAKVVVITSKSETAALKNQVGISDAEMQVILGNGRLDDKTISENLPTEDAQFHYVHLPSINTMDHKFLATSQKISKAWYLEFTIDWRGEWDRDLQLDLFKKVLPGQGFVCYWAGVDNLWRITDCIQKHYDTPTWSNVACVNARIPEAKPLLDKMDKIFAETLAKDLTY